MTRVFVSSIVFLGVFSRSNIAYAYLDAGTGSMILQLLIGGFAGVLIVGKLYWERLKSLFVRRRPIPDELVTANESESTAEPVTDGSQTG